MTRKLLTEANYPLIIDPSLVTKEWSTCSSGLQESFVNKFISNFEKSLDESTSDVFLEHWKKHKDNILQELLGTSKRLIVSGPCQIEGGKNGNGRIYPKELWDVVLAKDSNFMERLRNGLVLAELEHPESGSTKLPRVSHKILEVWRDNGVVYNKCLVFRTPMGAIAEELFINGVPVGQSSRGAGSTRVTPEGEIVEKSDYYLDTIDFVCIPSVAIARLSPVGETSTTHPSDTNESNSSPYLILTKEYLESLSKASSLKTEDTIKFSPGDKVCSKPNVKIPNKTSSPNATISGTVQSVNANNTLRIKDEESGTMHDLSMNDVNKIEDPNNPTKPKTEDNRSTNSYSYLDNHYSLVEEFSAPRISKALRLIESGFSSSVPINILSSLEDNSYLLFKNRKYSLSEKSYDFLTKYAFAYDPLVSLTEDSKDNSLEKGNFISMSASTMSLKEASDRTANARSILESAKVYLSNSSTKNEALSLDILLNHQTSIAESLSSLGLITESEFATDVANLRGSLSTQSNHIVSEINRLKRKYEEKEEDYANKDDKEDKKEKDDKDDNDDDKPKKSKVNDTDKAKKKVISDFEKWLDDKAMEIRAAENAEGEEERKQAIVDKFSSWLDGSDVDASDMGDMDFENALGGDGEGEGEEAGESSNLGGEGDEGEDGSFDEEPMNDANSERVSTKEESLFNRFLREMKGDWKAKKPKMARPMKTMNKRKKSRYESLREDATTSNGSNRVDKKAVVGAADVIQELANRNRPTDLSNHVSKSAYEEAVELGQGVVDRARSDRKALESMLSKERGSRRKLERERDTARNLLEAVVTKYRAERVTKAVDEAISRMPRLKVIEGKLRACETPKQVEELINQLVRPVMEGRSYPGDLPPVNGSKPLNESANQNMNETVRRSTSVKGSNLMEALKTQGRL